MDAFRTQLESVNLSGAIRLTTRYASGELVVPQEVKLEEADGELWIKYRFPVGGKAKNRKGALAHFLSLADDTTTADRWLKFAQEWSVLCICCHNLIASHDLRCFPRCDEPFYSEALASLADEKDLLKKIAFKMQLALYEIWFREPLSVWLQYARRMRALITIFRNLRGDERSNTLDDWSILRQIEMPGGKYGVQSVLQQYEIAAGVPIHQMPLDQQCRVLGNILSMWIGESFFVPRFEWTFPEPNTPSSALAAPIYSECLIFRCVFVLV